MIALVCMSSEGNRGTDKTVALQGMIGDRSRISNHGVMHVCFRRRAAEAGLSAMGQKQKLQLLSCPQASGSWVMRPRISLLAKLKDTEPVGDGRASGGARCAGSTPRHGISGGSAADVGTHHLARQLDIRDRALTQAGTDDSFGP